MALFTAWNRDVDIFSSDLLLLRSAVDEFEGLCRLGTQREANLDAVESLSKGEDVVVCVFGSPLCTRCWQKPPSHYSRIPACVVNCIAKKQ